MRLRAITDTLHRQDRPLARKRLSARTCMSVIRVEAALRIMRSGGFRIFQDLIENVVVLESCEWFWDFENDGVENDG